MQSILFFIKTTIKGGILFFLPAVFLVLVIEKVIALFTKIITPVAVKFGIENFAGKATIGILIVLSALLICFIGGLLMRIRKLQQLNYMLDQKLSQFIPSYTKVKDKAQH
jgi:uncharacterized membrane protein